MNSRINNIESTLFAYDDRLSYLNSSIIQLEQNVSDILAVIQPGHPLNKDNIVFQNILQSSKLWHNKQQKKKLEILQMIL